MGLCAPRRVCPGNGLLHILRGFLRRINARGDVSFQFADSVFFSDHDQNIPFPENIIRIDFRGRFSTVFDRDDIELIALAQIQVSDGAAAKLAGHFYFA